MSTGEGAVSEVTAEIDGQSVTIREVAPEVFNAFDKQGLRLAVFAGLDQGIGARLAADGQPIARGAFTSQQRDPVDAARQVLALEFGSENSP